VGASALVQKRRMVATSDPYLTEKAPSEAGCTKKKPGDSRLRKEQVLATGARFPTEKEKKAATSV